MLRKHSLVAVSFMFLLAVAGIFMTPSTVHAGSGSIPNFTVDNQLNVTIAVSCPGSVGFTWQVAVDSWGNIVYEEGSAGKTFRMDGSRISNGHHNALARVRCEGEPNDWSQAVSSTVGFDWFGGNPTPVPPPPGYEVSISITVAPTNVPPGTAVGITVQAACSNTTVRAIRVRADGNIFYELGSPVVTAQWSTTAVGNHTISAEAACNGDDSWKTSPGASVTITVQENVQPSGGSSSTATAGNQVNPTQVPDPQLPPTSVGRSIPSAQNGDGEINLSVYCQDSGLGMVQEPFNGDPNHWSCGANVLDMDKVCKDVWGNDYSAVLDPNIQPAKYAWRCRQGQAQVSPPTPGPVDNSCPSAPNPFKAGDIALVADANPSPLDVYSDAGNGQLVLQIPIREPLSIVGPQKCLSGYRWVQIGYKGTLGWAILVGPKGGYNLVANKPVAPQPNGFVCDGKLPARLQVGMKGRVVREGSGLFKRLQADQIRPYPKGTTFVVLQGPACGVNNVWYKVRVDTDGATGWFAEGRADVGYWLEPYVEQQAVATAVPTQSNPRFEYVARAPFPDCRSEKLIYNKDQKSGFDNVIKFGYTRALAICDPNDGRLVLLSSAFGGTDTVDLNGSPQQRGEVFGYFKYRFTSPIKGRMKISALFTVNVQYGVAAGSAVMMPDYGLKDMLETAIDHPDLVDLTRVGKESSSTELSIMLKLAEAYLNPTAARLNGIVYLDVHGKQNLSASQPVKEKGYLTSVFPWPYGKSPIGEKVENAGIVVSIIMDIDEGEAIDVLAGMRAITEAYGWSSAVWNGKREASYLTAIVFSQID